MTEELKDRRQESFRARQRNVGVSHGVVVRRGSKGASQCLPRSWPTLARLAECDDGGFERGNSQSMRREEGKRQVKARDCIAVTERRSASSSADQRSSESTVTAALVSLFCARSRRHELFFLSIRRLGCRHLQIPGARTSRRLVIPALSSSGSPGGAERGRGRFSISRIAPKWRLSSSLSASE